MKCRITGNRLCLLSNRKCPYYYLYSSPSACPVWPHSEHPKKERCVFGDGPARYKHPQTQQGYCSMACYKRIEEEYERRRFRVDIPHFENTKSKVEQGEASSSIGAADSLSALPVQTTSRVGDGSTHLGAVSTNLSAPTSSTAPQSSTSKPPVKPTQPSSKSSSAPPPKSSVPPTKPLSQSSQQMVSRPMMVTSTTPDGKTVQYQLNHARSILVNSSGVNIPIAVNQLYYLLIDYNGHTVATPHLMCGTTVKNGCLFYCMVPMVLMNNQSTKCMCLFGITGISQFYQNRVFVEKRILA